MSPGKLEALYHYAWETFYQHEPQQVKMAKLLKGVIEKEMTNGTHNRYRPKRYRGKVTMSSKNAS
jgi:hypothetical protein